jgi:hypothetical protein
MRIVRWLAPLPFLAMLAGPFFDNRVTPIVFGMPFLLAWIVAWRESWLSRNAAMKNP